MPLSSTPSKGGQPAPRSRTYGARKENRHKRPGVRLRLPISVSYTEQVVGALDNESPSGMGLIFLLEPPFRVGQRIRTRFQGAPRTAVVKHITLCDGEFRVGLEWDGETYTAPQRPMRDRRRS